MSRFICVCRNQIKYSFTLADFKNYLLTSGLNDLGIQPTPVDQQNIAENKIPDSLKADSINGNDKYSQLLSNQIIKKLTEMQYIK